MYCQIHKSLTNLYNEFIIISESGRGNGAIPDRGFDMFEDPYDSRVHHDHYHYGPFDSPILGPARNPPFFGPVNPPPPPPHYGPAYNQPRPQRESGSSGFAWRLGRWDLGSGSSASAHRGSLAHSPQRVGKLGPGEHFLGNGGECLQRQQCLRDERGFRDHQ
jgi:hypothetical protein